MDTILRLEKPADYEAITQLTLAAFTRGTYEPTEHLIILGLRKAGALSLSLVADVQGKIAGHVAFSPVTINRAEIGWYGLGPISVKPALQNQGIGSKLIYEGLARIRKMGAKGCVLSGSPSYYHRFGFQSYLSLIYQGAADPKYFMAISFYEEIPKGSVEYHEAFYSTSD